MHISNNFQSIQFMMVVKVSISIDLLEVLKKIKQNLIIRKNIHSQIK